MKLQVAVLLTIIGILKVRDAQSLDLEELTKKAKTEIEAVVSALKEAIPDNEAIRSKAKGLVQRLQALKALVEENKDVLPNRKLVELINLLSEAEYQLALPKHTRGILNAFVPSSPTKALDIVEKALLLLAGASLISHVVPDMIHREPARKMIITNNGQEVLNSTNLNVNHLVLDINN